MTAAIISGSSNTNILMRSVCCAEATASMNGCDESSGRTRSEREDMV